MPVRTAIVTACLILLTGSAAVGAQPNKVETPSTDNTLSIEERERRETKISDVIDPIYNKLPDPGALGSIVANDDLTQVTFYWKGLYPDSLLNLSKTKLHDFDVILEQARFSDDDLVSLATQVNKSWVPTWGEFEGFAPSNDRRELGIQWKTGSTSRGEVLASVRRILELEDITDSGPSERVDLAARRWNDFPNWNAGGALTTPSGGFCSVGFGIRVSDGGKRMLSAGHCGNNGQTFRDGTGNETVGAVTFESSNHDYLMIDAPMSTSIFVGSNEDADPGPKLIVNTAGANVVGLSVCSNGANSGEHCGRTIRGSYTDAGGWSILYARSDAYPDSISVVGGDSGGPIGTNGSNYFGPRGIIIQGSRVVSCGDTDWHVSTTCYGTVYYYSISTILNHHNATLIHG